MSSFIFGAGMLSTLHQLAPWNLLQTNYKTLNLSLKRLWNKPTLWDGSCFGGKRHKLSVQGHKTPQEWQGWGYFGDISAHSSALIGPCPRVAMCHPSLVTQSTAQLVTPGHRQRFVSSKWTCFRGKLIPEMPITDPPCSFPSPSALFSSWRSLAGIWLSGRRTGQKS